MVNLADFQEAFKTSGLDEKSSKNLIEVLVSIIHKLEREVIDQRDVIETQRVYISELEEELEIAKLKMKPTQLGPIIELSTLSEEIENNVKFCCCCCRNENA